MAGSFGLSGFSTRYGGLGLTTLAATTVLVLLQAYRVFVPYLVFEIDQSERTKLAAIALTVFALTFFGAVLFRFCGPRLTVWIALAAMIAGRLAIQVSEDPTVRWVLGAATVIACFWLLIVLLPQGGRSIPAGIGIAFAVDLMLRTVRGTLDLPWMPSLLSTAVTIGILAVAGLSAYRYASGGALSTSEAPLLPSARYIGIGSGLALWLVAAGNTGFAEARSGWGPSGAFALLAIGVLVVLWFEASSWSAGVDRLDGRASDLAVGLVGAVAVGSWTLTDNRWLELVMMPIFTFAVVSMTMHAASPASSQEAIGRWRTGATLTFGLLLQTAFIFLFFARTGPMELILIPLAVLAFSGLAGRIVATSSTQSMRLPLRGIIAVAASAVAILVLLAVQSDSPSVAEAGSDIRVMTFNIQEGFSNENIWSLEETARTIESRDADIVILQEITRGWLVMSSADQVRWLANRLDMDFAYSGNSHDGLWGNAILSKFPIESTRSVVYSSTDNLRRGAVAIEVATENGNLLVIDTHLDNPRGSVDVRLEQINELIGFWGGTTPAIIAGDFNADPGSPEWQAMIDAGFVDSAGDDSATTSEDARRIDYIFVTPDIETSTYTVPDVWVSDHRPVIVELAMPS